MRLIKIYRCLCDETRLRILNLLKDGELCVCHLQESLGEPQVKVSKHLAYLRTHGLVAARRNANWMIYSLPPRPSKELAANLACLQDCSRENPVFKADASKLKAMKSKMQGELVGCCTPTPSAAARKAR